MTDPEYELNTALADGTGGKRRNKKALTAKVIIAGVTAVMLALIGGVTAIAWPQTPGGDVAELPRDGLVDSISAADSGSEPFAWEWAAGINQAMADGDREAFLAYSSGAATEKMARWWDSTKAIGWDLGFAVSGIDSDESYVLDLGVQLAFSSHPLRGSGSADSGLILTQTFPYKLTTQGQHDDLVIMDWEPAFPMPWDSGDIYVAKRDHVVLYGLSDEQALVDQNIELAEESAQLTFSTLAAMGGTAPVDGFVAAITNDESRFLTWFKSDDLESRMDVAGFAAATTRPQMMSGGHLPPGVAMGADSSGSLVAMGPRSADQRKTTFVHEFAHVIHEAAVPYNYYEYLDPAPVEGFARYFENAAGVGQDYFAHPVVGERIAELSENAFSEEALRNNEAWVGYAAAGSFYQYVADSGASPWQLALDRDNQLTMGWRAKEQNSELSSTGWQEWAAGQ